jgi:tetratricopeptide (TPR) repeat protein
VKSRAYFLLRLFLLIFVGLQTANFVTLSAQVDKNSSTQKAKNTIDEKLKLLRQQGFIYLQSGSWLEAKVFFDQVLDKLPDDYFSLYGSGVALYNLGRIAEAETAIQKAADILSVSKENNEILADSLVLSAVILAGQKQTGRAIEELQKAVSLAPQNFDANLSLGRAYFGNSDLVNAVRFFQKAVSLKTDNLQARFFLATALERRGSFPEALKEYREVVKLNDNYAEGHLGLGVLLINLEGPKSAEGLNALQKAVSLKGNLYEARLTLGKTLVKLNRAEEAIEHLKIATQIAPNNPEPHYQLALAYRKTGKQTEAANEMEIVKTIHENRRRVSSKQ